MVQGSERTGGAQRQPPQGCQRPGSGAEAVLECVHQCQHQRVLAPAPALVCPQDAIRAGIRAPLGEGLLKHLRERGGIGHAQVGAETGQRMGDVGRIADQCAASRRVALRVQLEQGEDAALADEFHRAEAVLQCCAEGVGERPLLEGSECFRAFGVATPHQGAVAVGQRQKGDRPSGEKTLPGGLVVRQLGLEVGDDCTLAVAALCHVDTRQAPDA